MNNQFTNCTMESSSSDEEFDRNDPSDMTDVEETLHNSDVHHGYLPQTPKRRWSTLSDTLSITPAWSPTSNSSSCTDIPPPSPSFNPNISHLSENYKCVQRLGAGSFGKVWKIKHVHKNRTSALKVLGVDREHMYKRTEREIDILEMIKYSRSTDPGDKYLVRIEEVWKVPVAPDTEEDKLNYENSKIWFASYDDREDFEYCEWVEFECAIFIRMELCSHGSLDSWLKRTPTKRPMRVGKRFFLDIAEGLAYLQNSTPSVVHRDLKPANILLTKPGGSGSVSHVIAKIGDFGLARKRMEDSESSLSYGIGTSIYRSPEMNDCSSTSPYTCKADIFPLAIILFFILDPKYYSGTYDEKDRLTTRFRRLDTHLPQVFENKFPMESILIRKMLSNNPDRRPTAQEVFDSISAMWESEAISRQTADAWNKPEMGARVRLSF